MNNLDSLLGEVKSIPQDDNEVMARCVVRLRTSIWNNKRGIYYRKEIIFMKSLSWDFSILEEDAQNIGADVYDKITNIDECEDGLYEVIMCNPSYDWESGYLDDYDYELIPFKKDERKKTGLK